MPPTILIMMLLKMGPWAESDEKDESYTYSPFSPTPRWYQTWWAAALFLFLLLATICGSIFIIGYLLGY